MARENLENLEPNEDQPKDINEVLSKYGFDPDDPSQGGDAHEDDGQEAGEYVNRGEYETVQSQNAQLQHRLNVLTQNMMSPEYIQFLESKRNGGQAHSNVGNPQPTQQREPEPEENFDFEEATQADLVKYIEKKISGIVDSRVSDVDSRLSQQEYQNQVNSYKEQINTLAKSNSDFWEYRQDMLQLSQKYPTLGPEEIYYLAKGKAPRQAQSSGKTPPSFGGVEQRGAQRAPRKPIRSERPSSSAPMKVREDLNIDEALEEAMKNLDL